MIGSKAQRGTIIAGAFGLALSISARAQTTTRVSLGSQSQESIAGGQLRPGVSLTPDGRRVAFASTSPDLVTGDTNSNWDVFVRDRLTGAVERCSVSTGGVQGNALSGLYGICVSAFGRFVAYGSRASNLVAGDTNRVSDVFLRDLVVDTTERISVDSAGIEGDGTSQHPALSADGRFVAFTSIATNLVAGDTNAQFDVFVRDRATGITERVSVSSAGAEVHDPSYQPSISSDGRYVAFESLSSELVPGDTNLAWDVFVHDRSTGSTERVSLSSAGVQGNDASWETSISNDGRYVVFSSYANNLVASDTNGDLDVFLRDRTFGTTLRISVASDGTEAGGTSSSGAISNNHRFVVFTSSAANLSPGATSGRTHVFVHDLDSGATDLVSTGIGGGEPNGASSMGSISSDGRYVSFESYATNLVAGDGNRSADVFVHDSRASGAQVVCEPGLAGVRACPCANAPAGPGRGCDNSSATGGASLAASGSAYLSSDSLTFTTSGERATALSTVFEGTTFLPSGTVLGQGVRCIGGNLVRLYTKGASAGSITAPDLAGGDSPVSVRSAAKGLPIQAGVPTLFYVAYRDAVVIGGCPASSTFNATNGIRVFWWP